MSSASSSCVTSSHECESAVCLVIRATKLLCLWLTDWDANDSFVSAGWPVSAQGTDSCSAVSRLLAVGSQGRIQEC